jgi:dephospho-CoA kinase
MKWIGLTGGIATGKSSVAKILREMGYPVIDADILAREVVRPGTPGLKAVVQYFGRDILDAKGELNRPMLGQIIFADEIKREKLEAILHPLIQELRNKEKLEVERNGSTLAFYDVPLLFEKKMANEFDATVLVYANSKIQRARLAERNGYGEAEIEKRLLSQWPIEEKMKMANYVIFNESTPAELRRNVKAVIDDIG